MVQMDHMDASAYWQIAFALLLFACACRYSATELEKDKFYEPGPRIRPKVRPGRARPSSVSSTARPLSSVSQSSRDEAIERVQAMLLVSHAAYRARCGYVADSRAARPRPVSTVDHPRTEVERENDKVYDDILRVQAMLLVISAIHYVRGT